MSKKKVTRQVTRCKDCPALWQNYDTPESRCMLSSKVHFGFTSHYRGGPAPSNCPLRTNDYIIKLKD